MAGADRGAALLDALEARSGIVCVVGAGGKKSTLLRLVEAHRAAGTRPMGLTATVQLALPPQDIGLERVIADPADLATRLPELAAHHAGVAYALPPTKPGRLSGLPPALVADLHVQGGFAVTLVKADGARMRLIKAPGPGEPVLPPGVTTVLPVVSAKAIGQPLTESVAHRPERLAASAGIRPGEPITAEHVARLLASEHGALQNVGDATVVPVINAVDAQIIIAAREAARAALAMTSRFERIVLASMTARDPLLEVIRR